MRKDTKMIYPDLPFLDGLFPMEEVESFAAVISSSHAAKLYYTQVYDDYKKEYFSDCIPQIHLGREYSVLTSEEINLFAGQFIKIVEMGLAHVGCLTRCYEITLSSSKKCLVLYYLKMVSELAAQGNIDIDIHPTDHRGTVELD